MDDRATRESAELRTLHDVIIRAYRTTNTPSARDAKIPPVDLYEKPIVKYHGKQLEHKGNAILQARNRSLGGRWIENKKAEKGYSIRSTK